MTYEDDGVVMTELKGDPNTARDRPVRLSLDVKKKCMHLYFAAARLRKIDLSAQQEKVQISKVRNKPLMVLKFEIGYDLALEIDNPDVYTKVSCCVYMLGALCEIGHFAKCPISHSVNNMYICV